MGKLLGVILSAHDRLIPWIFFQLVTLVKTVKFAWKFQRLDILLIKRNSPG